LNRIRPQTRWRGWPRRAGPPLLVAILTAVLVVPAAAEFTMNLPQAVAGATYVGDSACMDCHDELGAKHANGWHGKISDFQAPGVDQTGCESCHGPGSKHVDTNEIGDILHPGKVDVVLSNRLCLQCHRQAMDGYESSMHALSDLTCVECHQVHGEQRHGLLTQAEPNLCNQCHVEVRNEMYLPSHHPMKEGKMVCTDCHDHHRGGYQTQVVGETQNDLCFSCHASKQGPFIFEHAPVVEDCMICHNAHGSVANNLLKQNEPFLCLQCHQMHFHAQLQGIEGEFTTLDGNSGTSHRDSVKRAFLTKCSGCHSQIHGSDLPAQSISGQGMGLTR